MERSSTNRARHWSKRYRLTCLALITACVLACTAEPPQEASTAGNLLAGPSVPVDVWVVRRSDGTGNPLWNELYIENLLWQASVQTNFTVHFWLQNLTLYDDTATYTLNQLPLLSFLRDLRIPRVITVVISNPETTDSAGSSFAEYTARPYFVMRSRLPDESGLIPTALIFLHELGHNMNLQHTPQVWLDLPFSTDDYWQRDDGRQYLRHYSRFLLTGSKQ